MRAQIIREMYGAAAPAVEALVRGFVPPIEQPNPMLADFYASTLTPRQEAIDFLIKRHGVPALALAQDGDGFGVALAEGFVEINGRNKFHFSDDPDGEGAVRAIIAVSRDSDGDPNDIVAWAPKSDRTASYHGRCWMLGAHELRDAHFEEPLRMHRNFLAWLKAGRRGAVVVHPAQAWRLVEGELLAAEDVQHGLELRKMLRPPTPTIVVPDAAIRSAA